MTKIDWAYMRKGWTSCKKAGEFLGTHRIEISETIDARKNRIGPDKAWKILAQGRSVTVAKGKKILEFTPAAENREAILKAAMGPSGNLRAPTLRIGNRYLVGFNPEMYAATILL